MFLNFQIIIKYIIYRNIASTIYKGEEKKLSKA